MNPTNTPFDTVKNEGYINGTKYLDANEYLKAKGGSTGGSSNVDSWFPSFDSLGQSSTDFAKGLNTSEDAAFKTYLDKAQSQQKPMDIYTTLQQQNQLPQMRATATDMRSQLNDLEDSIRRVEPTINATTGNSLVTEGQRQNMVNAGKQPLLTAYEPIATAYGRVQEGITSAEANVDKMVGLVLQGQTQELAPYEKYMTLKADQNARLMTGYTTDMSNRLNILLQKAAAKQALTLEEMQEAASIAAKEQDYTNSMKLELAKTTGDNRYISVGDKSSLYDTKTGKFINSPNGGGGTDDTWR